MGAARLWLPRREEAGGGRARLHGRYEGVREKAARKKPGPGRFSFFGEDKRTAECFASPN